MRKIQLHCCRQLRIYCKTYKEDINSHQLADKWVDLSIVFLIIHGFKEEIDYKLIITGEESPFRSCCLHTLEILNAATLVG